MRYPVRSKPAISLGFTPGYGDSPENIEWHCLLKQTSYFKKNAIIGHDIKPRASIFDSENLRNRCTEREPNESLFPWVFLGYYYIRRSFPFFFVAVISQNVTISIFQPSSAMAWKWYEILRESRCCYRKL